MTPAKKKPANAPVVVPLMTSPGTTPPPPPKGVWYMLRGTTIGGVFLIALGTMGFVFYLRTDKDHPPETALLWVSVGFIAAGFHFVSRQSVKNFIADVGKFLPWGKKDTSEQPTPDDQ